MRKFLLSGILLLSLVYTNAQDIKGSVIDESGKSIANATVSLLKAKDSSLIKLGTTDKDGAFRFKTVSAGKYLVSSSFVGYQPRYSGVIDVAAADVTVPALAVTKTIAEASQGVTVVSKKPMIEVRADKMVVNVENSINAVGNDALELLRKSPGVQVDKDDNLSLAGKNGVQVFIDGRPSPLSGKDLSDYLKTIQSTQIEAIELITNPSAKYEAAGNAGIINIRLKKNKSYGTNGSLTAGYNIGVYSKYNAALALNQRQGKVNLFGNYNYNRSLNEFFMYMDRSQLDTLFNQHSVNTNNASSHTFKAGMDYYASSRSTFGVMVNGSFSDGTQGMDSRTLISYEPTGVQQKQLVADNSIASNRKNVTTNLNYRYADTSGRSLNVDFDYGYYDIKSDQYQPNVYLTPDGKTELSRVVYNMIAPTKINTYSLKADYEQDFKKGKLSYGGKAGYTESSNNFERYNVFTSTKVKDTLRSNNFKYTENINALYVNYNRQYKGFMVQLGVRAENTNAKGTSEGEKWENGQYTAYDSSFTRHYTDLFPSAAVTLNKNPMKQWTFSYSRRIDRPAYQDLNPFEFKLDEYTYQKGNTQLMPQYTNSVGVTFLYKYQLTTSLNYSRINSVFTQLIDTIDKSKSFITKKNLANQDAVSLNISMPLTIKKYNGFFSLTNNYSHYKADFGKGRTINLDAFNVLFYAQNTYKVSKTVTAEVSGWFTSPSIWQGTFKTRSMWSVDAGAQKTILKGKGIFKATVSDVFQTMRWKATSDFAGQHVFTKGGWESRLLKLSFTWRFGNNQVKAARQRKTASEEESKRVDGAGGGIGGGKP